MKSYRNKSKSRKSKSRKIRRQKGGNNFPPSFQGIPMRYYYDMNDYKSDPNNPSNMMNSRLSGGKKSRKNNKIRQRGGFIGFGNYPVLGNTSFNVPASFGNTPFAFIGQNIQAGSITSHNPQNPSTIDQPIDNKYNYNHPPLA
jgi:hypothetical protein